MTNMERLAQAATAIDRMPPTGYDLTMIMEHAILAIAQRPGGRELALVLSPIVEAWRGLPAAEHGDRASIERGIRALQAELELIDLREKASAQGVSVESLILAPMVGAGVLLEIVATKPNHDGGRAPMRSE